MSLSKSSRHVCHYEPKTDNKFFTCYGCKRSGFGTRFNCECGHELHTACKNRKPCINHEYFGSSTLTFLEEPCKVKEGSKKGEHSKFCDACGKDISGYSYHCEKDKLDLHPCCANLEKKLLIDGTVFNLVPKVSKKCKWCHKTEISIGDYKVSGWSYVSTCKTYNLHVYCMTDMVHEASLKHGDSALEKVDLKQLAKTKRNGWSKWTTFGRILKSVLSFIASVLLGDPTILMVDLLTGG